MKRPSTEGGNMFVTNKSVITSIYESFYKPVKKKDNSIKMGESHTQTFHKGWYPDSQ